MNLNALLEVLLGMLIVVGIAGSIAFIVFLFWTVWFIPVYKQHKFNIEKQQLESEVMKIEVRKADSIMMIEELKTDYAEWAKKLEEAKQETQKITKSNAALVEQIETAKRISNAKKSSTKN